MRGLMTHAAVAAALAAGCDRRVPLARVGAEQSRRIDEANATAERIEAKRRTADDTPGPPPRDEDSEPARTRSE